MHSGEKSSKCNQCDFASSQASDLRRRLKTHSGGCRQLLKIHNGEKLNICSQCYFASSHAGNLNVWVVLQWKKSAIYVTMEETTNFLQID